MSELNTLQNIGAEIEQKLKSAGITTAEDLIDIGSEEAFMRLKAHYPKVCLVHLYALEGAVSGVDYNKLSESTKKRLKSLSDNLK